MSARINGGNCRTLPAICGSDGVPSVKCGKCGIRKPPNGLLLRFSGRPLSEWGSGGRWFESSRPDIERGLSSRKMNVPFSHFSHAHRVCSFFSRASVRSDAACSLYSYKAGDRPPPAYRNQQDEPRTKSQKPRTKNQNPKREEIGFCDLVFDSSASGEYHHGEVFVHLS